MTASLLEDTERRCVEATGDVALCMKAINIALEAVVNRRVQVAGRPAYVTAWVANYEELRFGVNDAGEIVLEFSNRGLPTISIYVTKDRVRTVVADVNYIAMHNHHDRDILRIVLNIVKKK